MMPPVKAGELAESGSLGFIVPVRDSQGVQLCLVTSASAFDALTRSAFVEAALNLPAAAELTAFTRSLTQDQVLAMMIEGGAR